MGMLSDAFSIRIAFASLTLFALLGGAFIAVARFKTVKRDMV